MILATVIQCDGDGCDKVVCLKIDDEWNELDATWQNGLLHQFCPDCKNSPEAKTALAMEAESIGNFAALADVPAFAQV